jgi:hypothetical protein
MGTLFDLLDPVLQEVQVSPTGHISHVVQGPLPGQEPELITRLQQLPGDTTERYRLWALSHWLKAIYYHPPLNQTLEPAFNPTFDSATTEPAPALENNTAAGRVVDFFQQLHRSNQGSGYWDPGWQVLNDTPDGLTVVQKSGLKLTLARRTHLASAEWAAEVGDRVAVRLPKNLLEPGWYVAIGDAGSPVADRVQLYWNLPVREVTAILQSITARLNGLAIPFSFKVPDHPAEYPRCDAGILTLNRADYAPLRSELQQLHRQFHRGLGTGTPALTKPLARGLSLAECPPAEPDDFGLHRCRLVAQGLLAGASRAGRRQAVVSAFEQAGISPDHPYLNPMSADLYTWP